jgi:hypothetical protein
MNRAAELTRIVQQAQRLDPVEAAFRAVVGLSDSQRDALTRRFNSFFAQCTPALTLSFHQSEGTAA